MLQEGEKWMVQREENHPENLLKAKDLFLDAADDDPLGHTRAAEALFWLGEYASSDNDKETYHKEGVDVGKLAVADNGDDVAAHLWFAANMGSHGMVRGIMSSLFYLKDLEKHGKRAMEIDDTYFFGAPLRLMGRFYHQCPGWPVGSGDLRKAIKLLEQAVETGPDFLLNHYYLADAYLAKRRRSDARDLLDRILAVEEPEIFPVYLRMIQDMARELGKKIR